MFVLHGSLVFEGLEGRIVDRAVVSQINGSRVCVAFARGTADVQALMSTGIMAVLISNLYLSGQIGGDADDETDVLNKSMRGLASPTSLVGVSFLFRLFHVIRHC
jgi:hypothetical protein